MKRYNPKAIEAKWQQKWSETKIYQASDAKTKPKKYVLEYFPYPSGAAMHVGHVRNYTIGDAVARFNRMRGYNVLHPMGWDAFGLPAENYAIKNKISPQEAVSKNVAKFKKQLTQMGFSYDWSREINSTDPNYYKWTQYFFLLLFKRGLAYQKEALVNWDPIDKTVLANEQVIDGRADRSGALVEKKALKQWFFKITTYADRLEKDLDDVNWSESIKTQQRNWIGRSKGAEIDFEIKDTNHKVKVFTTRPDTLFGATFIVLAPEHPLVTKVTAKDHKTQVENYIKQTQSKSDIERQETGREKSGVFTGVYAINPVNHEPIPIWVADYVLYGYGTGAIMAVPGHDQRDFEFATKFGLPVKYVVEPTFGEAQGDETYKKVAFIALRNPKTNEILVLDWGPRQSRHGGKMLIGGGLETNETYLTAAEREIVEETGYKNFKLIKEAEFNGHGYFYSNTKNKNIKVTGRGLLFELLDEAKTKTSLDDGEKDKFKITWQPTDQVADMLDDGIHAAFYRYLVLGEVFTGEGLISNSDSYDGLTSDEAREKIVIDLAKKQVGKEVMNYKIRDWLISRQRYWGTPIPIIHCPDHGAVAVPEQDLPVRLPEIKSYEPSGDGRSPLANVPEFVNTSCPVCGQPAERETDTMDGFACSSWYFLRFADPHNHEAAFDKTKAEFWLPVDDYIGGAEHAVMHLLYARFWTKVMYDEGLISFNEPFLTLRNQGMILAPDGQKMSKSKGNTIEPDGLIEQGYGADSIRIMELFIGPWNQMANWSIEGLGGSFRFLQRVWTLVQEFNESEDGDGPRDKSDDIKKLRHQAIAKVSDDLENLAFNTAIAALMEFTNNLYLIKAEDKFGARGEWLLAIKELIQLLAPFAPHIAEELWQEIGQTGSVHVSEWPVHEPKYLISDKMTIVVQVNGKVRANIELPSNSSEEQISQTALADSNVAKYTGDNIKKTIFVPGKLINFVV